jgi:hypothetical protein
MPKRFGKWFKRQLKNRPKPLRYFWKWSGRGELKGKWKRSRAIKNVARHRSNVAWREYKVAHKHAMNARDQKDCKEFHKWKEAADKRRKRFKKWNQVRLAYKTRQANQHRRWKRKNKKDPSHRPAYQPWMLNGHSGNLDERLKPIVAYQVVVCKQITTDTYDYAGHTPDSYHYPHRAPDRQGHAIDTAGGDMCGAANSTRNEFGNAYFAELFSPCGWYIKYGTVYGGYFPGHGDHGHYATPR